MMSLALAVGAVVVAASGVVLVLAAGAPRRRRSGGLARVLLLVAGVVTVAVAAALLRPAWRDSGAFALVLVGVPVIPAVVVLGLTSARRRAAPAAAGIAAVVTLVWALLTSLGLGLYFVVPGVLMCVAAAASVRDRAPAGVP